MWLTKFSDTILLSWLIWAYMNSEWYLDRFSRFCRTHAAMITHTETQRPRGMCNICSNSPPLALLAVLAMRSKTISPMCYRAYAWLNVNSTSLNKNVEDNLCDFSGGTVVTLTGSHLDSVAEPYISLTVNMSRTVANVTTYSSNTTSEVRRLTLDRLITIIAQSKLETGRIATPHVGTGTRTLHALTV